ncbi:MAG TPA: ATP-binding protein [Candidatus Nanopelagicales bacterium]|nr:ATP-binding protein [Candidatus Nanopelagicales bacterium]
MSTLIAARRRRPSVTASVSAIALAGVLALMAGLALEPALPAPEGAPLWASPAAVLLFVVATAVAEIVRVPLMHEGAVEDLTFFEIVTVAAFLLLDPRWALVAPLAGLAVVQVVLRKAPVKAAFNLGSYAVATSAAVLTYLLVCGGEPQFALRGILGLLVGMGVFAIINTVLLAVILHAAQGASFRSVVTDFWALPVLMTFASISVGAVAVAVAPVSPALVPFTALPALALWYAFRSAAQQEAERERNTWLVTLSGILAEERPLGSLVEDAAEAVRKAFGAPQVALMMPEEPSASALVGACAEPVSDVPVELVPAGWSSATMAVLELGAGRHGVLLLGSGPDSRWALGEGDAAVLTTVAASLSSSVRGIEHRDALTEESSKLKAVVEHITDGIAVIGSSGTVTLWSPAMARITGVSPAVATATSGTAPDPLSRLRSLAAGTRSRTAESVEVPITRPDGEQRDVAVNVVTARPGDGDPIAVVTVHDVTSQARTDRLKSDFVATISHELRTPLTPIKGYAQLLLARYDKMSDDKREQALALIAERADHMGRLVEDLLMASRASGTHTLASKLASAPTPHDLRDVVAEATSNFPYLGARLTVDQPLTAVPVFCDEVRAVQIVSNLVSNAAKYSPDDAPISVRIHPNEFGESHARVDVVDRGQGISADDLERVFERFYRVEDSLTMRTSGSGLGLYIARELAVAMGGSLTVSSSPGRGSTFSLALPRTEEGAKSTKDASASPAFAQTA